MAKATSGLIPTITVRAPRRLAIWAMLRRVWVREGVEHVERGDVDDDAPRAVPADPVDQVVLESLQLTVVQGGVDGRDEVAALPQDGDQRWLRRAGSLGFGIAGPDHFETQHPFGFFDAALQIAHGD